MTTKHIKSANKSPHKGYILGAGDLKEPAKLIPVEVSLVDKHPNVNDSSLYLVGFGDVIGCKEWISSSVTKMRK